MYDLGLYVGLFEIPRDFIGLPGLYGFKYDGLIALVIYDGSITASISAGSTLNLSYVYLKQRFYFLKKIIKYASGHLLYA